jgi:hypothetical protein
MEDQYDDQAPTQPYYQPTGANLSPQQRMALAQLAIVSPTKAAALLRIFGSTATVPKPPTVYQQSQMDNTQYGNQVKVDDKLKKGIDSTYEALQKTANAMSADGKPTQQSIAASNVLRALDSPNGRAMLATALAKGATVGEVVPRLMTDGAILAKMYDENKGVISAGNANVRDPNGALPFTQAVRNQAVRLGMSPEDFVRNATERDIFGPAHGSWINENDSMYEAAKYAARRSDFEGNRNTPFVDAIDKANLQRQMQAAYGPRSYGEQTALAMDDLGANFNKYANELAPSATRAKELTEPRPAHAFKGYLHKFGDRPPSRHSEEQPTPALPQGLPTPAFPPDDKAPLGRDELHRPLLVDDTAQIVRRELAARQKQPTVDDNVIASEASRLALARGQEARDIAGLSVLNNREAAARSQLSALRGDIDAEVSRLQGLGKLGDSEAAAYRGQMARLRDDLITSYNADIAAQDERDFGAFGDMAWIGRRAQGVKK